MTVDLVARVCPPEDLRSDDDRPQTDRLQTEDDSCSNLKLRESWRFVFANDGLRHEYRRVTISWVFLKIREFKI